MFKKRTIRTILAMVLCLTLTALIVSPVLADIDTNNTYDGTAQTINITGTGMAANEDVQVDVTAPDGSLLQSHIVQSDADGNFADAWVMPIPFDFNSYTIGAIGLSSGLEDPVTTSEVDVNWDGQGTTNGQPSTIGDYEDLNPGEGQLGWLFIMTQPFDPNDGSTLTATFSDGTQGPIAGVFKGQGQGSYHYVVYTSADATLINAMATNGTWTRHYNSQGKLTAEEWSNLTVSHGEYGGGGGEAESTIRTEVWLKDGTEPLPINAELALASEVYDKAFVEVTNATLAGTVTFELYKDGIEIGSWDVAVDTTTGEADTPAVGPLHPGSYYFQATYSGDAAQGIPGATSGEEPFSVDKGDVTITTDVHVLPSGDIVTSVTFGATVYDTATVTGIGITGFAPTGTVTFALTKPSGNTSQTVYLPGTDPETVQSSNYLVKSADIPGISYQASYSGSDDYNLATSDPEPLTVASSITAFEYQWLGSSPTNSGGPISNTGDTTWYNMTSLNPNGTAANVPLSTNTGGKNKVLTGYQWFLVHVKVANNTGVSIGEKVQGGLAASATYYQSVPIGSGGVGALIYIESKPVEIVDVSINDVTVLSPTGATINNSNAKTNGSGNGNVITWTIDTMTNGTSADLYVIVVKGYTSKGLQAVTSSWSEVQTWTSPDGASHSEKSPYTGDLYCNVQ
jgi:hypothetical protein